MTPWCMVPWRQERDIARLGAAGWVQCVAGETCSVCPGSSFSQMSATLSVLSAACRSTQFTVQMKLKPRLKVETEVLREGEQNKRIAVHEPSAATPSSACILICNCLQPTVHCNDVKHHKFLVHLSKLANGAHLLHTAQCAFGTISTDANPLQQQ